MPPKAFLAGDAVADEFYIAYELKMTVAQLREMDNLEFLYWTRFFAWKHQSEELASKRAGVSG